MIAGRRRSFLHRPLKLFPPLPISLVAAAIAAGVLSGPRRSRRAPAGVRRRLVPTCSLEDLAMRYDWTPVWRSTIGFDRLFDVLDEVQRTADESYPPSNIKR